MFTLLPFPKGRQAKIEQIETLKRQLTEEQRSINHYSRKLPTADEEESGKYSIIIDTAEKEKELLKEQLLGLGVKLEEIARLIEQESLRVSTKWTTVPPLGGNDDTKSKGGNKKKTKMQSLQEEIDELYEELINADTGNMIANLDNDAEEKAYWSNKITTNLKQQDKLIKEFQKLGGETNKKRIQNLKTERKENKDKLDFTKNIVQTPNFKNKDTFISDLKEYERKEDDLYNKLQRLQEYEAFDKKIGRNIWT